MQRLPFTDSQIRFLKMTATNARRILKKYDYIPGRDHARRYEPEQRKQLKAAIARLQADGLLEAYVEKATAAAEKAAQEKKA